MFAQYVFLKEIIIYFQSALMIKNYDVSFKKKEFLKISKIWSFMSGNFFRKIPQNFLKFSQLFQNRKKLLLL